MFKFETQLNKLKHEVLTEVVKLVKDKNLSVESIEKVPYEVIKGDTPTYRCCVYKERAIVLDRAKLATGYYPNSNTEGEHVYTKLPDNNQVIYVIEAACDRCPLNRFSVTDSCRNCLAHKCQEACNFGAISIVNGRAYINQEICKECGMCQKACPYHAISEVMRPCKVACPTGALDINHETRRALIKEEKCVNCGACMSACPFGAIGDKSSIVHVTEDLISDKKVYAVVAPAITGQFGNTMTYGKIKNAIKQLGFADMKEVALGADAVTAHESIEFIERMENGDAYMTNSCCPGFFSFIEKMFPTEKDKISGTVSPMVAIGRYIKKYEPDAKVVFIGPCTAKKAEALKDEIKDSTDYVLTFEELLALFEGFGVDPYECEEEEVDEASIYGRGFGASGGLTAAIQNYVKESGRDVDFKPIHVSGQECKKTMTMAKIGRLQGNFIEGMMCDGGCINGAGTVVSSAKAKATFNKINGTSTIKTVLSNKALDEFSDVKLSLHDEE